MKTKKAFIILVILIIVLIGWLLVFKKPSAPTITPGAESTVTAPGSSSATTTTKSSSSNSETRANSSAVVSNTIYLNGGQHVSTTNLVVGQKVVVSVADPVDAGYQIDPLQYNSAVIGLVSHSHSAGGMNGIDTWQFMALKTGTTGVSITASQPNNKNSTVQLFSNAMSVK